MNSAEMTPVQWALRPLRKYAQFSGRAPRREFWWFLLVFVGSQIIAIALESALDLPRSRSGFGLLRLVVALAMLLPFLSVSVRRFHDLGRTGLWVAGMWFANMVANGIVMGSRSVGARSTMMGFAAAQLVILGVFVIVCARAGTNGPNEYGPDPYDREDLEEVFA
jgi:uncharacterized membrane protein YhaH (DUF805 family)